VALWFPAAAAGRCRVKRLVLLVNSGTVEMVGMGACED